MKILGILWILIALALTARWICTEHQHKAWAISVGLVAIFVGIYFTVQDRAVEITIENVGMIKAASQQATIDAKAVAKLKKRVESQSATVDLVAGSASKAHNLIEDLSQKNKTAETKIEELESANTTIQKTILALQETAEFTSFVAAAQNDDRIAFNKLGSLVDDKTSPYWQHAADAVVRIRTDFGGVIKRGNMIVNWPKGTDPTQLSFDRVKREYQGAVRVFKADLVKTVWESSVIDKNDKMSFFIDILEDDDSLHATHLAGKYFVEEASDSGLKWSPFLTKPLLDWWAKHEGTIDESD